MFRRRKQCCGFALPPRAVEQFPRGWRLPKTPANELKPNLFEFLQRVQQCFNKVKGNCNWFNYCEAMIEAIV